MDTLTLTTLLVVGAASGLLGAFALMRRMTLASDAMSHIALPGIALALLFSLNPLIGAFIALLFGAVLIWGLEQKTKIATETIIGVVFSLSLAIGALLTTDHELIEALFGGEGALTRDETLIGLLAGIGAIISLLAIKDRLTLSVLSPDIAHTTNVKVGRINLLFLVLFSVVVAIGLKFLGVLLMGSLVIIPAATAKNIARNLSSDLAISTLLAVVSVGVGYALSLTYSLSLGPTIICFASALFLISVFFAKNH